jgi:hypothetical protein
VHCPTFSHHEEHEGHEEFSCSRLRVLRVLRGDKFTKQIRRDPPPPRLPPSLRYGATSRRGETRDEDKTFKEINAIYAFYAINAINEFYAFSALQSGAVVVVVG